MITNHGYFIRKNKIGFYKMQWMSLVNSEIYFFNEREAENHNEMHIIIGAYVNKIDAPVQNV
jgi:hypothetical protein